MAERGVIYSFVLVFVLNSIHLHVSSADVSADADETEGTFSKADYQGILKRLSYLESRDRSCEEDRDRFTQFYQTVLQLQNRVQTLENENQNATQYAQRLITENQELKQTSQRLEIRHQEMQQSIQEMAYVLNGLQGDVVNISRQQEIIRNMQDMRSSMDDIRQSICNLSPQLEVLQNIENVKQSVQVVNERVANLTCSKDQLPESASSRFQKIENDILNIEEKFGPIRGINISAVTGPKGEKGDDGQKGRRGEKGQRGLRGFRGKKGIKGDSGIGDVSGEGEVMYLPGQKGEIGQKGEKGQTGFPGLPGLPCTGIEGIVGPKGDPGLKGVPGLPGRPGQRGPKGDKGDRGDISSQADPDTDSVKTSKDSRVRLRGGTNSSGRVEVFHNRLWGTVCDAGWEINDAIVVCRMFGFSGGFAKREAAYGPGSGVIWLKLVSCDGTEKSIFDCGRLPWGSGQSCDHGDDAGVECF